MNKFERARKKAEILSELNDMLQNKIDGANLTYQKVGEEQSYHYEDSYTKKVLDWEDEEQTVPTMRSVWDYVPKDELSDEDRFLIDICEELQMHLESLI